MFPENILQLSSTIFFLRKKLRRRQLIEKYLIRFCFIDNCPCWKRPSQFEIESMFFEILQATVSLHRGKEFFFFRTTCYRTKDPIMLKNVEKKEQKSSFSNAWRKFSPHFCRACMKSNFALCSLNHRTKQSLRIFLKFFVFRCLLAHNSFTLLCISFLRHDWTVGTEV